MVALNPQCWWGQLKLEQNKLVSLRLKILSTFGGYEESSATGGVVVIHTSIHVLAYQPHNIQSRR